MLEQIRRIDLKYSTHVKVSCRCGNKGKDFEFYARTNGMLRLDLAFTCNKCGQLVVDSINKRCIEKTKGNEQCFNDAVSAITREGVYCSEHISVAYVRNITLAALALGANLEGANLPENYTPLT